MYFIATDLNLAVVYKGEFEVFRGEVGEIVTTDGVWRLVQFRSSIGRMWVEAEELEHI